MLRSTLSVLSVSSSCDAASASAVVMFSVTTAATSSAFWIIGRMSKALGAMESASMMNQPFK